MPIHLAVRYADRQVDWRAVLFLNNAEEKHGQDQNLYCAATCKAEDRGCIVVLPEYDFVHVGMTVWESTTLSSLVDLDTKVPRLVRVSSSFLSVLA